MGGIPIPSRFEKERNIFDLPDHSFVQFGDFSGYTISQCAKKGMSKAHVGGFIGKFAKMATGVKQTHVKGSKVDMDFLSELAKQCNADEDIIQKIITKRLYLRFIKIKLLNLMIKR